ncbi:MAG: response regulator [Verrucomicrobiota bacterium]|nr:response regulator [Limisphaera sp.]MDW8381608.1 response regulator [Verrucomicrobiota bacterium]
MGSRRLLIVEDEAPVAQLLASAIRRLGYIVVGVTDSAQEGLRLAAATRPDLAVLDIELHGRTEGFDLARRLRNEFDIPSIFLTGRSDESTLQQVRQSGSFGYLLKPFHPQELKACMELALQRHARESHLIRLEQALSAAVRCAADAVILTNASEEVLYLNPAAERLTGWKREEATGRHLQTVFQVQVSVPQHDTAFLLVKDSPAPTPTGTSIREALLLARNQERLPIELTEAPLQDEVHGRLGSVFVFRDITERKRYEQALQESRERLRALARNLEATREEERTRIAREIHDELGQMLTKLKMDLAWVQRKATVVADPVCEAKIQSMLALVDQTVQTVRRISSELRPGLLDTLGLPAAVEAEVNDFQTRTGIACELRIDFPPIAVERHIATALYRILQESLTNITRHARASKVSVRLEFQRTDLVLEISDNGRGASPKELQRPGCFGLLGMRERAHALGGDFCLESQPGHGTRVQVRIPHDSTSTAP